MLKINANHFVEGVKVVPTPNKSGVIRPRLLVVHDTAGQLDHKGSVSWLCNPQAKASAHFVVGRNGEIVQLAATTVKTWHAGKSIYQGVSNVNDFAIGIEIANPGKLARTENGAVARASFGATYNIAQYDIEYKETPEHGRGWWMSYPQAQLDAVLNLAMAIRARYDIDEVAPHWQISPGRKIDVNPLFPLSWLRAKMKGRTDVHDILPDAMIAGSAHIRSWPSFNEANIKTTLDPIGASATILRSGTYAPTGDTIPPQTPPDKPILWYSVQLSDGMMGWVPYTDVAIL